MIVGIPKETFPAERRVALIPASVPALAKAGCSVVVEAGAGYLAGYADAAYELKGASIAVSRDEVFDRAEAIFQLLGVGANPVNGVEDLPRFRKGQKAVGFQRALGNPEALQRLAATGATVFALEMLPRVTRAQTMDALSSMSTAAGYSAVLLAASTLPKMFPMMMTAAGTISPARVLIVGVGVSGLQAIATAKRLGAVVSAYDVRPAVKEQVQSLGARFIELPLDTAGAEDAGGYARAQDEGFYRRQRELMAKAVADSDVVITTANVPGRKAPVLITAEMVAGMSPGSVIVDLAAERGGNCELTRAAETVSAHGVTILGPVNLPSMVPFHASQMYSNNITAFFTHMVKEGRLNLDLGDAITRETLVAREGEVVHPMVREALGLAPVAPGDRSE
ncbi:MAG TPA: Re/Si-specific NAD(P)(+) transhydrogenase subunit alpha [Vicinamibacteria bacterium]|nr:Re/Si-specific NAD(P)(+) transhydrogenase subunit alpha [Vicinamibacteria bacterium]